MQTLSDNLKNNIAQQVTTLATLWRIIRHDGVIMGFTNLDADIVYDGLTYLGGSGFDASSIQNRDDLSVNNLEITSFFKSDSITIADMEAGKYDFARVDIFVVNYADLTQGHIQTARGTLGQVVYDQYGYRFELRGLSHSLETNVGRMVTPTCDAVLGDFRCKVSLSSFTFTATVTEVTDQRKFKASSLTQIESYFKAGEVIWTSGENIGSRGEIRDHKSGGIITMILPFNNNIAIGDSFQIITGCDKSINNCKNKFNNIVNFRGFPSVPGFDAQFQTAGTL
jgi:uncharacterized phage protein (TIGR02218 family)